MASPEPRPPSSRAPRGPARSGPAARDPRSPAARDPRSPAARSGPAPRDPRGPARASADAFAEEASPRKFALICGAIALPLLVALTWSMLDRPGGPTPTPRVAATVAPSNTPTPTAPAIRPQAPAVAGSITLDPPRKLARLGQLSLGTLHADGRLAPSTLGPALGRRISVVNVWATYCAPCMRELPRLLDLLAARPWGNDLRFVPVLLEAPDRQNAAQQAAITTLRQTPTNRQLLVDLTPAGALQTLLNDAGLLPERATLPLTLVLDCEQRLRWLHRGEITDTAALTALLEQLHAELPRCAAPPQEPVAADACGDDYCDPERAEDCATCQQDCACPENRECVPIAGRRARCNFRTQGLKD